MEVEIEDLHLQIDDIAKAKTAVRLQGIRGRAPRVAVKQSIITVAAFTPDRPLYFRAFCKHSGFLSSASVLRTEAWKESRGEAGADQLISLFNHLPMGAWPQFPAP